MSDKSDSKTGKSGPTGTKTPEDPKSARPEANQPVPDVGSVSASPGSSAQVTRPKRRLKITKAPKRRDPPAAAAQDASGAAISPDASEAQTGEDQTDQNEPAASDREAPPQEAPSEKPTGLEPASVEIDDAGQTETSPEPADDAMPRAAQETPLQDEADAADQQVQTNVETADPATDEAPIDGDEPEPDQVPVDDPSAAVDAPQESEPEPEMTAPAADQGLAAGDRDASEPNDQAWTDGTETPVAAQIVPEPKADEDPVAAQGNQFVPLDMAPESGELAPDQAPLEAAAQDSAPGDLASEDLAPEAGTGGGALRDEREMARARSFGPPTAAGKPRGKSRGFLLILILILVLFLTLLALFTWMRPILMAPDTENPASKELTVDELAEIERMLSELLIEPGPIDGVVDDQTREAIRFYQESGGLPVDGEPTAALLNDLREVVGGVSGN